MSAFISIVSRPCIVVSVPIRLIALCRDWVCLQYDIVPWFQYAPSKLNVSGIWSRPDRKKQRSPSAKRLLVKPSTFLMFFWMSFLSAAESCFCFKKDPQTEDEIVNPGGTGRPSLHISAMFAPFPPKTSDIDFVPSVFC